MQQFHHSVDLCILYLRKGEPSTLPHLSLLTPLLNPTSLKSELVIIFEHLQGLKHLWAESVATVSIGFTTGREYPCIWPG